MNKVALEIDWQTIVFQHFTSKLYNLIQVTR